MSKITVIDDNKTIVQILTNLLADAGHEVDGITNPSHAFSRVLKFSPDLIILDVVMPHINGHEFCRVLRNDTRTAHLPIIMLTSKGQLNDKVAGLEAGADDYITKPFEAAEVIARVNTQLRRAKQKYFFSPLTGLPGNVVIEEEIKKCLALPSFTFAILYFDLDYFKAYNDNYGFLRGDELLREVSNILREHVQCLAPLHSFVGHIGGDDFIALVPADCYKELCENIIQKIDAVIPAFYSAEDRKRGFVTARDRLGQEQQFPLVSISIAAVTNNKESLTSIWEIGELSAALKKKAKSIAGSVYVTNE